jgi:hypothetical protein
MARMLEHVLIAAALYACGYTQIPHQAFNDKIPDGLEKELLFQSLSC